MRTKINLLVISILISSAVFAQEKYSKPIFVGKEKKAITGDEVNFTKAIDYSVPSTFYDEAPTIPGSVVGYTFYDLMTNGSLGKGLIRWNDNTMATILMSAIDSTSLTTTRGSYYNYYKFNLWKDTTNFWRRIQNARRGWGRIAAFSDRTISTLSHGTSPNVIEYNTNIGTWDNPIWNSSVIPNLNYVWPKFALDDDGQSYFGIWWGAGTNGGNVRLNVFGSTDAGATWQIFNYSLMVSVPPSDTNLFKLGYIGWGIEDYGVSAKKGKVAFAGYKKSGNVYVFITSNKGASWDYRKIYDAAKIDTTLNTIPFDSSFFPQKKVKMLNIPYCDGTGDVMIDTNGVVHVTWGTLELGYQILVDSLGNPIRDPQGKLQRQFFTTDYATTGIWYWNSNMTQPVQAVKPNSYMIDSSLGVFNKITHVPRVVNHGMNMGIIGMPSLVKDNFGHTFIVFQGFRNKDTLSLPFGDYPFAFGHVYVTGSNNGINWMNPWDFFGYNINKEDICFPFTAEYADYSIHIIVQNDKTPGNWVMNSAEGHPQNKNYFINSFFPIFINDLNNDKLIFDYKLEQNYPNPFNPITRIKYSVGKNEKVTLKVFDILGSEVATLVDQIKEPGNYELELDGGNLSSGVYFYQLSAGDFVSTKKCVLLK